MELFALALFVLSTSGTPGPNNVMILTSGVNHGLKKSIPHMLGINLGFPLMIIAVGFGAMQLFNSLPLLYIAIKIIGVVYLTYLAIKIATMPINTEGKKTAKPFSFIQAASFQWVNPKAWVMAVSAIVAFSAPGVDMYTQLATIALFYLVFGLPCTATWLVIGVSLQKLLSNEQFIRGFNVVMAGILLFSLIPMVQDLLNQGTQIPQNYIGR